MKKKIAILLCLLACLAVTVPMVAQQRAAAAADPLTGTWTGDWGPSSNDRNQVSVELKWDGKTLTGTVKSIQPARPDVMLQKSTYTAATNAVHMEAESPAARGGGTVHFIIDGKLAGNTMTGSWNHDTTKGDFKLTKK
jgi:hypothetical protein